MARIIVISDSADERRRQVVAGETTVLLDERVEPMHLCDNHAARQLIERQCGLWIPVALHWGWEADADWDDLRRLAELIGSYTAHWDHFLEAIRASADNGNG